MKAAEAVPSGDEIDEPDPGAASLHRPAGPAARHWESLTPSYIRVRGARDPRDLDHEIRVVTGVRVIPEITLRQISEIRPCVRDTPHSRTRRKGRCVCVSPAALRST
eukprot:COSAG06_NODE_4200_length_4484_cov_3.354846_3_plen_107_part_00